MHGMGKLMTHSLLEIFFPFVLSCKFLLSVLDLHDILKLTWSPSRDLNLAVTSRTIENRGHHRVSTRFIYAKHTTNCGKSKQSKVALSTRPVAPRLSYFKDQYNLTWTVDSFLPIEEYRILYRVDTVSGLISSTYYISEFFCSRSIWHRSRAIWFCRPFFYRQQIPQPNEYS